MVAHCDTIRTWGTTLENGGHRRANQARGLSAFAHLGTAALAVGQVLPLLPLALDKGITIPLDLEATYLRTCQESRIPVNGK